MTTPIWINVDSTHQRCERHAKTFAVGHGCGECAANVLSADGGSPAIPPRKEPGRPGTAELPSADSYELMLLGTLHAITRARRAAARLPIGRGKADKAWRSSQGRMGLVLAALDRERRTLISLIARAERREMPAEVAELERRDRDMDLSHGNRRAGRGVSH